MKSENSFKSGTVEVFTTNIESKAEAKQILKILRMDFPSVKLNFDLGEAERIYPCKHSILRIEGDAIDSERVMAKIKQSGFNCDFLEDKVCY
jgi:predicted Zn-dependent protease